VFEPEDTLTIKSWSGWRPRKIPLSIPGASFRANAIKGHLACQIGSRGMALRIIGIDHGSKETLVRDCGAEEFLDITKFDDKTLAEEVKKVTGGASDDITQYALTELFQVLEPQP
jgi:hypothetical protein